MRRIQTAALILAFSSCEVDPEREVDQQLPSEVTFAEHIAPIVHQHCTPCHRPGQPGPFSLITYEDVRKRARTIRLVTGTKLMPPWPADRTYRSFAGERGLAEDEIALIADWVDNGALPGDAGKVPPPPTFPSKSGLGKPDLVLKMVEPYTIEGNNRDHFVVTKIPIELTQDRTIRAIEFVPDNTDLLHHMNAHLVNYRPGAKARMDGGEHFVDSQAYTSAQIYERLDLLNDDGSEPVLSPSVCNYLPGVTGVMYPENVGGWHVNRKSALLIKDIHYGPTPKEQTDQSTFNIFFASKKPERPVREVIMGTLSTLIRGKPIAPINEPLTIPPGVTKKFSASLTISRDLSLLTVNPHMHLLGKSFLAYAVDTRGDTIPLVKIPRWDFRWQYFYTFKKMLRIPKGSTIYCEGEYDNTSDNPNNPFDPPQAISGFDGSMKTTDEMFQFIISYLVYQQGDEEISLEGIAAD